MPLTLSIALRAAPPPAEGIMINNRSIGRSLVVGRTDATAPSSTVV
jgi:hypothetical protein